MGEWVLMGKFRSGIIIGILILLAIALASIAIYHVAYNIKYGRILNSIVSDTVEIEKKWLINKENIPYNLNSFATQIMKIEQTYICFSPEIRVRKINDGEQYTFTVKTNMTSDGLIRDEMEISITEEQYNALLKKQEGNTIYKTRYQFLDGDYVLAVDIFSGELEGLAYLEIEFENQKQSKDFQTPNWVIKDITSDLNYKNGYLARYGIPDSFLQYIK